MNIAHPEQAVANTERAVLVPLGRFAQQIGLAEALGRVSFKMKTVEHSPVDKTMELLAHIMAGGMHINELHKSAHPLVKDTEVAEAWGQKDFASASGVSALLRSVSLAEVDSLKSTLHQVMAPYRRRVLRGLTPSFLVVDLDLTGLVVSDQATTYEGADFGYMGELDKTGRGYQFARAQLVGQKDTLVLGGFLHSGHTVAVHCLAELVALVEAELGRPRRRVELVERRLVETESRPS